MCVCGGGGGGWVHLQTKVDPNLKTHTEKTIGPGPPVPHLDPHMLWGSCHLQEFDPISTLVINAEKYTFKKFYSLIYGGGQCQDSINLLIVTGTYTTTCQKSNVFCTSF